MFAPALTLVDHPVPTAGHQEVATSRLNLSRTTPAASRSAEQRGHNDGGDVENVPRVAASSASLVGLDHESETWPGHCVLCKRHPPSRSSAAYRRPALDSARPVYLRPGPRAQIVNDIKQALVSLVDERGIVPVIVLGDAQGLRDELLRELHGLTSLDSTAATISPSGSSERLYSGLIKHLPRQLEATLQAYADAQVIGV